MNVFEALGAGYEQVVFAHDPSVGLRTIVAVYSTALGPALGGTRFWPFVSEEAAFADVLRLAKAMAYKASAADLNLGGGKAVVIGDPKQIRTPELLRAYGRVVDGMGGAYVTTADVGTSSADMDVIAEATRYVTGTTHGSGDPSPVTAYGVLHGLRAVARELWDDDSLRGKHVVVQGVGKVGGALARYLAEDGAELTLADVDAVAAEKLAAELGAATIEASAALSVPCDILAPCALGPVVTDETLPALRCRAIGGAANNQLERPDHADALVRNGILYAPDYVINAGGLINVEDELHGYDAERAHAKAAAIGPRLTNVFARAREENVSPAVAADRIAEDRIAAASKR
jgi:glutamate dehydrogenase/leucine dehydrogenase